MTKTTRTEKLARQQEREIARSRRERIQRRMELLARQQEREIARSRRERIGR